MTRIVADSAIVWLDELFAPQGEIVRYSGREIDQKSLNHADLLITRSTVNITSDLLANSSVKLVASATVGRDHVNEHDLKQLGIPFVHAPGCNANAVADYVVTALAWHDHQGLLNIDSNLDAAIIGGGQIGSRVKKKLEMMGFRVVVNDPPVEKSGFDQYDFVSLAEALQCDVICLHTPLTYTGAHPSYHLLDKAAINEIKPNAVIINAGRGEVIDNNALLERLQTARDLNVVLDVWEREPDINWQLLEAVNLGTPHIAGHSWRGKAMGTIMVYEQACEFFRWVPAGIKDTQLKINLPAIDATENRCLYDVLRHGYDIESDYLKFKQHIAGKSDQQKALEFDNFRRHYPRRPEFSDLSIHGLSIHGSHPLEPILTQLIQSPLIP